MNKLLMAIAAAGVVFAVADSAFAATHGGHVGGFTGNQALQAHVRSDTNSSAFSRRGVQRFVGRPYGVFLKSGNYSTSFNRDICASESHNRQTAQPTPRRLVAQPADWQSKQLDPQTAAKLRNWGGKRDNSARANEEHRAHKSHHHDHHWWRHHRVAIVFFDGGYWGWEGGWWFPAWGYDPYCSAYYAYRWSDLWLRWATSGPSSSQCARCFATAWLLSGRDRWRIRTGYSGGDRKLPAAPGTAGDGWHRSSNLSVHGIHAIATHAD